MSAAHSSTFLSPCQSKQTDHFTKKVLYAYQKEKKRKIMTENKRRAENYHWNYNLKLFAV